VVSFVVEGEISSRRRYVDVVPTVT
jgi:hypothetical protein